MSKLIAVLILSLTFRFAKKELSNSKKESGYALTQSQIKSSRLKSSLNIKCFKINITQSIYSFLSDCTCSKNASFSFIKKKHLNLFKSMPFGSLDSLLNRSKISFTVRFLTFCFLNCETSPSLFLFNPSSFLESSFTLLKSSEDFIGFKFCTCIFFLHKI